MNKITVFVLLTLSIVFSNCKNANNSKEEIKEVFKEFNTAHSARDGKRIYDLTDEETHSYYDSILKWSLTASKNKLDKLRLIDHMNVLSSRIIFGDSLKSMSAKDLMIKGFNKGDISKDLENTIKNAKLNLVVFQNEHLASSVVYGEIPIKFIKENGKWKYNYIAMIDFGENLFKKQRLSNDHHINMFLLSPDLLKYSKRGFFLLDEIYTPINDKQ